VPDIGQMYCVEVEGTAGTFPLPGIVKPNRNKSGLRKPSPKNSIFLSFRKASNNACGVGKLSAVNTVVASDLDLTAFNSAIL